MVNHFRKCSVRLWPWSGLKCLSETSSLACLAAAPITERHCMTLTLAGMVGSPMFTKELNFLSFIQLFPSSKVQSPASMQVSILGWIRPDATNEGTVLVTPNKSSSSVPALDVIKIHICSRCDFGHNLL
jgi:hypothetical protein